MRRTYRQLGGAIGVVVGDDDRVRVTPAGVYRLLRRVAEDRVDEPVAWRRIYLVHQEINRLARQAKVKVPFAQTLLERRRVKALLVGVPETEPLRKEAFQWSRR